MRYLDSGKIIVDDLEELRKIIRDKEIPLELIDIKESKLTTLDLLFSYVKEINGSIENWDISNINSMYGILYKSKINPDLSKWDISNVTVLYKAFAFSEFNGNISEWKFNSEINCVGLFYENDNFKSKYNKNIQIPIKSKEFLSWFNQNKCNIKSLNMTQEDKDNIEDYLLSFDKELNHH